MEEQKKRNGLVVPFIITIILLLGLVGYICYDKFLKNVYPSKQEETNASKKMIGITGDELDKIEPEDGYVVFYEKGKKISAFKCDGVCKIYSFGEYPDEGMNDPIKESDYKYINPDTKENLINLNKTDYVLIGYCQKDSCEDIGTYVSAGFVGKDSNYNAGKAIIFNVETARYTQLNDIEVINLFDDSTFELSTVTDDYVNEYEHRRDLTLVFNDGTFRKIDNTFVNAWCWEAPCSYLTINDSVISIDSEGKYGIENIKTGKEVIAHKYDMISNLDNEFFSNPLVENTKTYLKVKENGKTNMYELTNDLKQVTKEGYDAIYLINPTTLFVYRDNNFYFMDMQENILSNKLDIKMSSFEQMPHESSIMFKKIDNNSMYIRIVPNLNENIADDTKSYYYKYNLSTKQLEKVSGYEVCGEKGIDVCF